MFTPEFMPILSAGKHSDPKQGACVMEYASFLAGEEWTDQPACTHPVLAAAARRVNDRLGDDARQGLLPLLPRLMGTSEGRDDRVLNVHLAVWSAEYVFDRVPESAKPAARAAIDAAVRWADDPSEENRKTAYAAYDAYAAGDHVYATAVYAVYAAAVYAAHADDAAYAAYAAYDAYDADDAADADGVAFLTGLIDEYDRLTRRTTTPVVTAEDLTRMAGLTR